MTLGASFRKFTAAFSMLRLRIEREKVCVMRGVGYPVLSIIIDVSRIFKIRKILILEIKPVDTFLSFLLPYSASF